MPKHASLSLILAALLIQPIIGQAQTPPAASATVVQNDPDVVKKAAWAAFEAKNWPESARLWKDYLAVRPGNVEGHRLLGASLRELGQTLKP